MAAEAAADVAEDEPVVAGVQTVRETPVEAREARLHAGAGRVVRGRAAGRRGGARAASAPSGGSATAPAPSAAVSRQRRTLCRNAWTRVT